MHQLSTCSVLSSVDHFKASFQCLCFHFCSVLSNVTHCWHPCKLPHKNDKVSWQILQVNYLPLLDRMPAKQNTVDSHFVTVICGYILVCMCLISISGLRGMKPPAWCTTFTVTCNMMPLTAFSTGLVSMKYNEQAGLLVKMWICIWEVPSASLGQLTG